MKSKKRQKLKKQYPSAVEISKIMRSNVPRDSIEYEKWLLDNPYTKELEARLLTRR